MDSLATRLGQFSKLEYTGHKKRVFSVGWNSDGTCLASASADSTVVLWSLTPSGLSRFSELREHTDKVDQIAWSPGNPNLLASASSDKTARIWDTRTPSQLVCERAAREVITLAWHPTQSVLGFGSTDNILSFYDLTAGNCFSQLTFKKDVHAFTWDHSGNAFFVTTSTGEIHVFRRLQDAQEPAYVLKAHTSACHYIAMDPAHPRFATGGLDSIVLIWDLFELTPCASYMSLEWEIRQICFSHDGALLATASEDTFVDIVDTERCERCMKIVTDAPMYSVAWHPKAYVLAYSGEERSRSYGDTGNIRLFGEFT